MKTCPKCKTPHDKQGTFCSRKCANSRSWSIEDKEKKRTANLQSPKILLLTSRIKSCQICGVEFQTTHRVSRSKACCGEVCQKQFMFNSNSTAQQKRCQSLSEKLRLRDIGRRGGFGKKGTTAGGTKYQSTLEKNCFEYLENKHIPFIAHRPLPNSSKISDCYIPSLDLWIEIDGIDREKRQKWLENEYRFWQDKMQQYESRNLKLAVVKTVDDLARLV